MKSFFSKLFGTVNDRKLRELKPRVERINLLEPKYQKMTDGELQNQTKFFKEKLLTMQILLMPQIMSSVLIILEII